MSGESDEDVPQLSASTFAALQQFYDEQEQRETKERQLHQSLLKGDHTSFNEDWQLSQFWYDQNTIEQLVQIAIDRVGLDARIALVSCPTLYQEMKKRAGSNAEVTLFEFDERFAVFGHDFVLYDYRSPLNIPRDKSSYYDIVLADPPFLSDECLTKTAVTVKYLTKKDMLLCTGAVMSSLAKKLLDLEKINFEPKHNNNLANEFWCFTNFSVSDNR